MFYRTFLFLVFLCALLSCNSRQMPHQHSFYYWKTTFPAGDSENIDKIEKSGVEHFYIRYMDVDWNDALVMPVPCGQLQTTNCIPFTRDTYTPVVYITNRTFEHITDNWIDSLALRLTQSISSITADIERKATVQFDSVPTTGRQAEDAFWDSLKSTAMAKRAIACTELQIDCDWTNSTKEKYFRFLRKFKSLNPGKTISATVRMYPYKYSQKMGIPPVDRGMLMCYNLGKIKSPGTTNSIFDLDELRNYLDAEKYPLPLDIALPVFGWQVWFRGGKYKGIVHNIFVTAGTTVAYKKTGDNSYRILKDTVIGSNYYREGDELRLEIPGEQDLQQAVSIIDRKIPDYGRLTFFDWNTTSVTKYEKTIQAIFNKH